MFLENDLSQAVSLDGEWQFQLADQLPRTIQVPSAWEASTDDKLTEGPAVYRRSFPLAVGEGRYFLECDAVSFAAVVRVNGRLAGEHTGLWTRWQLDVTPFVRDGENEIEIEVWKPGEGRYKLRESLAGFLPDVCNTFGGIWQGIRLRCIQGAAIVDLRVRGFQEISVSGSK
jgi:beta-galactosidase